LTNTTFVVNGTRLDRDSLQLRTGLTSYSVKDWNFDISYNAELADNFENHAGVARAVWKFD
jgi:hypothetical protein